MHIDNFLAFFTQRRLDDDFGKYDCELTMLDPPDVLLNGLDDKLYQIHESDLEGLSSYYRAKKNKTLHTLFPLMGTVESKFFSRRIDKLLPPDPNHPNSMFAHYKNIWKKFEKILSIIHGREIESEQDSLTAFHHKQISCTSQPHSNIRELISDVVLFFFAERIQLYQFHVITFTAQIDTTKEDIEQRLYWKMDSYLHYDMLPKINFE